MPATASGGDPRVVGERPTALRQPHHAWLHSVGASAKRIVGTHPVGVQIGGWHQPNPTHDGRSRRGDSAG